MINGGNYFENDVTREIDRLRESNADLLAALKALVNDFDKSVWTSEPMLIKARAAIQKAERGTS